MKASFTEFKIPDEEAWKHQIKKDLKSDNISNLLHQEIDGISSKIAYQEVPTQSFNAYKNRVSHHPEFAFANDWEILVSIKTDDLKACNKSALQLLEHGASSIAFTGFEISNQEELRLVLKGINCEIARINFNCGEATPSLFYLYLDEVQRMHLDASKIFGSIAWDPLGDFIFNGSFNYSKEESMQLTEALLSTSKTFLPNFKTITVNGARWHNAGASASQELAAVLSLAAEYVINLQDKHTFSDIFKSMQIQLASGSEFFIQLAKFRAVRILWDMLLKGFSSDLSVPLWLQSETSLRNKTRFDAHSNLVRGTLESMAVVIGGSDEHLVHPFNYHFEEVNEDSQRLALNIHHLLKYESGFDKVLDASAGSPYIEHLTKELVEKSWSLFLEIESKGGYTSAARLGFFQDIVKSNRSKIEEAVRKRKRGIIGVNRFAYADEKVFSESIQTKDPLSKLPEIKVLEPYFEASSFESIRRLINLDKQAVACLILSGNPLKSKQRATFAGDFLSSAGFKIVQTDSNVQLSDQLHSENVKASDLIVLCSADEEYESILETLNSEERPPKPLWIAGNPANSNDLKKLGVDDFIYLGCDAIKAFHSFLETLD